MYTVKLFVYPNSRQQTNDISTSHTEHNSSIWNSVACQHKIKIPSCIGGFQLHFITGLLNKTVKLSDAENIVKNFGNAAVNPSVNYIYISITEIDTPAHTRLWHHTGTRLHCSHGASLLLTQQDRFYGQNVLLIVAYSGEGLKKIQSETSFWCTSVLRLMSVCSRVFSVWCTPALQLMSVCGRVFAVWCTPALRLMSVCGRVFAVSTWSGRCTCLLLAAVTVSSDCGTPWSPGCPWCLSLATRHQ